MPQRKILEEDRRGPVQKRTSEPFAAPNDVDEPALVERLEHGADRHAPDLLDLRPTDGLTVRDERQRLQRCAAQPSRASRKLGSLDRLRVFAPREDLPSTADLHQLDTVSVHVVMLAQLLERSRDSRFRRLGLERSKLIGGNSAGAGENPRPSEPRLTRHACSPPCPTDKAAGWGNHPQSPAPPIRVTAA